MMDFEKELIIMIFGRKRDVCGLKKGGVINVIVCIKSDVLIWKQDFIFVWDKIFYHTSLMKMWHFYLLEKRDVLLQDCYKNEGLILKEPFLFNFNEITY